MHTQQPSGQPLGREIRYCPRKQPGMVFAIVSTILGLLTAVLLMGISGEKSTKPGDITFVSVLMSIFLGIGFLLFFLRYRTVSKRTNVRVFEHGIVHTSGSSRQEIRFADAAKVDFGRRETTFSMWIFSRNGGSIGINPDVLQNVDNTLAVFIKERIDNPNAPVPPISATPGQGQVTFRAGSESNPPLLGKGTLAVTTEGVRMVGPRARTALPMVIACATGVMGVVLAAVAMTAMDMKLEGRGSGKLAALIGLAAGIGPGIFVYDLLRKRMRSRRIDVLVPWSSLLLFKHRSGGVGATVTTYELRGNMEIIAQDEAGSATLEQLTRVGPHAEYGFSS